VSGKKVIRVLVPRGDDPPSAVDDNQISVRSESETGLAVRDEIVGLVLRGPQKARLMAEVMPLNEPIPVGRVEDLDGGEVQPGEANAPRTGVEIVSVEERNGGRYYTVRDLRNGNVVKNVTPGSARRLWHYALTEHGKLPADQSQVRVQWQGNLGLLRHYKQGKSSRFDLAQRTPEGTRYYFGVTEEGIHGPWKSLVGQEDE
jgi:hypothetical protein